jgi:hypothetical protein
MSLIRHSGENRNPENSIKNVLRAAELDSGFRRNDGEERRRFTRPIEMKMGLAAHHQRAGQPEQGGDDGVRGNLAGARVFFARHIFDGHREVGRMGCDRDGL